MSITQDLPQINTEIDAARARWAEKRAQLERQLEEKQAASDEYTYRELLARMAKHLPAWMLAYVQPKPRIDYDIAIEFVRLDLPGCSPIYVIHDTSCNRIISYEIVNPLRIVCDDFWWVRWIENRADDLDEAIDMVAANGESYHEMATEAARRNEQGLRPEPPELPPALLDIARRAADNGRADAGTWALLAISEGLNRIASVLENRP